MPPGENWWVVLADFGISKRAVDSNGPTTVVKGTDGFMAPELLNKSKLKQISDFQAADMWALGEITFRLLTGEATFESPWKLIEYCKEELPFQVDRLPPSTGEDCQTFICSLMEVHPGNRMTTTQCLEHGWMESQRISLEEKLAGLNKEQNGSLVLDRPDVDQNHSANWSTLSIPEPELAQTTVRWRPTKSSNPYYTDSRQTQLEQVHDNPRIQRYSETSQESLLSQKAALKTLKGHSD
jgi:serine/threonine protein kinase